MAAYADDGNDLTMPQRLPSMESRTADHIRRRIAELRAAEEGSLILPPSGTAAGGDDIVLPGVSSQSPLSPAEQAAQARAADSRRRNPAEAPNRPVGTTGKNPTPSPQSLQDSRRGRTAADAILPDTPQMQSGILPGEEQVTTRDTFDELPEPVQAGLQGQWQGSGHSGAMSFEDWLSANYADLAPEARAAAMTQASAQAPRMNIGVDPHHVPGENTALAKGRVRNNMPLPEGREPKQYTPEQSRTMSRNVHNPDIPMGRFGGTFTHNPDGSLSSRAPNPSAMARAEAIASDPAQGPGSDSHIIALADAFGIDAQKYGDDLDMLRADVTREYKRHQELGSKYDTVPTGMGGYRYTPNARMQEHVADRRRMQMARDIGKRYGRIMSDEQLAQAEVAMQDPANGFQQLVSLGQQLRMQDEVNRSINWQNRRQNIAMTNDMNNPMVRQGMGIRSLLEAVRSGDPLQVAAVHDIFNSPAGATQNRQLAAVQAQADATARAAQTQADNDLAVARVRSGSESEAGPEALLADAEKEQLDAALANQDPVMRRAAVKMYVDRTRESQSEEERERLTSSIIASHVGRTGGPSAIGDPDVQAHLSDFKRRNDRDGFIRFVMQTFNVPLPQARQMYDGPGWGYRAGGAIGNLPSNLGAGMRGLWNGLTGNQPPGQ